jgi:hypothetical protein
MSPLGSISLENPNSHKGCLYHWRSRLLLFPLQDHTAEQGEREDRRGMFQAKKAPPLILCPAL